MARLDMGGNLGHAGPWLIHSASRRGSGIMGTKRVLMAWERGAGFGHSTQMARLGVQLQAAGVEVVAAVRRAELCGPLVAAGIRLVRAPAWPAPAPGPHNNAARASATLTDTLASAGLSDPASVQAVLAGWRAIFDAERPDLLVCDYAPLAAPAARGLCPVMQVGTAYCLPPAEAEDLPVLHEFTPRLYRDRDLLAAVNTALDATGLAPLERIGGLFAGDDVFVRSFPLLDPYADMRANEAEGPILNAPIAERRADARGIFAYLHLDVASRPDVAQALHALGRSLEIHVPGAGAAITAPLRAAGARVHEQAAPIAQVLARSRLLLHQGSAGIASEALLAGVPQLTLSIHAEHYFNGEALAAAGVGRNVPLFDPRSRIAVETIAALNTDPDIGFMAEAAGRIYRTLMDANPLDTLTRRCLALL
ncbi:glycosyltransferase [Xanthobacter sp. AM11]|uniref:glycosyltransferase n=1 Tax=Xanthobacter sp. AM11 TaxID=3380643 RepID=UPI0039BF897D